MNGLEAAVVGADGFFARLVRSSEMRALVALVLLLMPAASCGGTNAAPCDLGNDLVARAGSSATDCGHALLDANAASVDNCVAEAFSNHSPFFAQYDRRGTDSKLVFGLAGDSSGKVTFLLWDGDPSGGSGAPPVITGDTCEGPAIDPAPGRDTSTTPPIMCASTVMNKIFPLKSLRQRELQTSM